MVDRRGVLEEAKGIVKVAIALDNQQAYQESFEKYCTGIKKLLGLYKTESSQEVKQKLFEYIEGYMSRAEKIKSKLENGKVGFSVNEEDETESQGSVMLLSEDPNVKWADVSGLKNEKAFLLARFILPLRFEGLSMANSCSRVLLYGAPGTGKSFLARALANESSSTFFRICIPDFLCERMNRPDRRLRSIFEAAREKKPSMILIDDIDLLCEDGKLEVTERLRRLKTSLLIQLDGCYLASSLLIVATSSSPWVLDKAFLRRFDSRVLVPLLNAEGGISLLRRKLSKTNHSITDSQFDQLSLGIGFSGADIAIIAREAIMMPIRSLNETKFFRQGDDGKFVPCDGDPPCPHCPKGLLDGVTAEEKSKCTSCGAVKTTLYEIPPDMLHVREVNYADLLKAVEKSKPSVTESELEQYLNWSEKYGQEI